MAKGGKKRLAVTSPHERDGSDDSDDEDKERETVSSTPKRPRRAKSTTDKSNAGDTDMSQPDSTMSSAAPASTNVRGDDAGPKWAPGQWEAWKKHRAREERLNKKRKEKDEKKKTVETMVAEFGQVCVKRGWYPYSYAAIRAHKKEQGEDSEYNTNPMTDTDRDRARALFEEHKNWALATEKFNEETGRSMTRDALVQAVRRRKPAVAVPMEVAKGDTSGNYHRWTDLEIQTLKKYTNCKHKELGNAFASFTKEMGAAVPDYQPRQWIAFMRQLGLVRSAIVETGKTSVSVGRLWKGENDAEFDELAGTSSSMSKLVEAASRRFGCTKAFARQLYHARKPLLKWQRDPSRPEEVADEEEEDPTVEEDADRRPERLTEEDDDAEPGMLPTRSVPSDEESGSPEVAAEEANDDESSAAAAIIRLGGAVENSLEEPEPVVEIVTLESMLDAFEAAIDDAPDIPAESVSEVSKAAVEGAPGDLVESVANVPGAAVEKASEDTAEIVPEVLEAAVDDAPGDPVEDVPDESEVAVENAPENTAERVSEALDTTIENVPSDTDKSEGQTVDQGVDVGDTVLDDVPGGKNDDGDTDKPVRQQVDQGVDVGDTVLGDVTGVRDDDGDTDTVTPVEVIRRAGNSDTPVDELSRTDRDDTESGVSKGSSGMDVDETKDDAPEEDEGQAGEVLSWAAACGYTAQTPWVIEPGTPTSSHLNEDEAQMYTPQEWAYEVPEEQEEEIKNGEVEGGPEASAASVSRQVPAGQWSRNEEDRDEEVVDMLDTSTREGWIMHNVQQGITVNLLSVKQQSVPFGVELYSFEIDDVTEAAERDTNIHMSRGHVYHRVLQEWTQCLNDSVGVIDSSLPRDVKQPVLTNRRMTEMAVMIVALNDYAPYKIALLRHFGRRWKDPSSFGDCYGDRCCLGMDFGVQGMVWTTHCRHWLFFAREQVYLDRFRSAGDYRLAMALSCTLQALNQVRMKRRDLEEKRQKQEPEPYGVNIDVISVTKVARFFDYSSRMMARPYARILLDCMVVIIPGAAHYGAMANQYREATRPTTFGTMWTGRHGDKIADAVLCRYDGQDFWLANTSLATARKLSCVYWVAEERLQTHSRRCGALEECAELPKIRQLAARDASIVPRYKSYIDLIEKGKQYQYARTHLDEAQMRALDAAVKHVGIIPIRGPFGCGKTRLIASIITVQLETYPNFTIFVTSETNAAIDEDLRRLYDDGAIAHDRILRLGDMPRHMDERYRSCMLSERVAKERATLRSQGFRGQRLETAVANWEANALDHASVIFATTATFGREQYRPLQAQVVINDEGAQTTEVSLIQALREMTMTLIPIGDPNQLFGRIEVPEGKVERYEAGDRRHKLNWSVIHALGHSHEEFPGATLTAQYRSHPKIGWWLRGFYDFEMVQKGPRSIDYLHRVVTGVEEDEELPVAGAGADAATTREDPRDAVMGEQRIALISCNNEGRASGGGERRLEYENQVEVWKVVELVLQIGRECNQERFDPMKSVIVVTPYNQQKDRLEKELQQVAHLWKDKVNVSVHTIDSCQGREADIAIVSMVRVEGLGFLAENKPRTLVALSRGRDYLFVLARRDVFIKDSWWEWLYASAIDPDVDAVCAAEMMYSDEAEAALNNRHRLRELCSPLLGGSQRADVVKSGAQKA